MRKIEIFEEDQFVINKLLVTASLELVSGKLYHFAGENGVGKSTFFNFLKTHQHKYFPKLHCQFIDQLRFNPLNEISFLDLKRSLIPYQHSALKIYEKGLELTKNYQSTPIKNLSGGQNQMIKILVSSFLGGDIFFLDEPLQYLDKENKYFVKEFISELKHEHKIVCLIEHNHEFLQELIDENYFMQKEVEGIKIAKGKPYGN